MSHQPRSRGRSRRFGQPTVRKTSRERKEDQTFAHAYQEPIQFDRAELSSKLANALQHLGGQRFPLPPYGEHFQRWLNDVQRVLTEFETGLGEAADQQYKDDSQKIIMTVQEELSKRIQEEKNTADASMNLQKQLTAIEIELTKLESDYNRQNREIKKRHEKASAELQQEISELGKQRSMLLRNRSGLLDRIFRRSNSTLEEKTSSLQSRKKALGTTQTLLSKELEKGRAEHANKRKRLLQGHEAIRAKMSERKEETEQDDALEIRKRASEELQGTMSDAMTRSYNQSS